MVPKETVDEYENVKAPSDTGRHMSGRSVLPYVTDIRADTGVLTMTVKGVVDVGAHLLTVATGDLIPIYLGTMGSSDVANECSNTMATTLDNSMMGTIGG